MSRDSGEDILSVIFLALICIVICGIANKIVPNGLAVPTFALVAVCLWVAYDYILLMRYKAKKTCKVLKDSTWDDIETDIDFDLEIDVDIEDDGQPEQKHINEFDIAIANGESIQAMHSIMGCDADTQVANRMKYMALQPKLSKDIRAKFNARTLLPYFDEEFRDNDKRDWWDAEQDKMYEHLM